MLRRVQIFICLLVIPSTIFSQRVSLSGYVTGTDSSLVTGATITLKGTTFGTVTDKKGFYRINKIDPGIYTLRVSFIGFETQEKTVDIIKTDTHLDFLLKESNIDLNEVVVTGTKSEKTLKNVPVITQVISARKMMELGITNVPDALQKMVPGLSMSQFGTRASVTLQGMDSKYVLFLIDGERIAGEVNGDIDYSMLSFENIDRIEVIKGASSSLYGSNAIGGVINIITKKINEPFDAKFYSRYSKYNEIFTGGSIGLKQGIIGSRTSCNFSHTDGYNIPGSPYAWTQYSYNSINVNQKFEITPSSNLSIVPYFGYYQFERKNGWLTHAHDLYKDFNTGFKGQYFLGKHSFDFSYYRDRYNTFNVYEQVNNGKDSLVSYDIIQTVRTQGNFHLSDKNSLIAGLEYNHENLFSVRLKDNLPKDADEAVVYVQEDIRLGERWNFVTGIRASYHSSYGLNAAPKISVMFKQGSLNFRASAGSGFRSPSLKELYMNFDHFGEWYIIGNTQLKPESSKYISGSAEFSKSWNNSSVTVYRNELSDMITDRWLPDSARLTRQYVNIASATVYGVDFISKQKICKGLWLSTGYSYVHSHDNDTGLQLYGTTKHSGNISADYNFRKKDYSFTAQIYCKLMGEKFYEVLTDVTTSRDRPYSSMRITISQEYRWLRVSTGLDNVFNVVIPQNLDFISPGRRFFIGLNIDFGKMK
jgi:outer membrane receptor for ferrienterochelin and colicins